MKPLPVAGDSRIPTTHEPLSSGQVRGFASWLDEQLRGLEDRFAAFTTADSCAATRAGNNRRFLDTRT